MFSRSFFHIGLVSLLRGCSASSAPVVLVVRCRLVQPIIVRVVGCGRSSCLDSPYVCSCVARSAKVLLRSSRIFEFPSWVLGACQFLPFEVLGACRSIAFVIHSVGAERVLLLRGVVQYWHSSCRRMCLYMERLCMLRLVQPVQLHYERRSICFSYW